ncbi:MAG: 16S rRNA (cytidine(1402)-2'-O)-methyltransferase [Actinomycetota bacterium]
MSGKLFICGTPIGNLEDVTLRLLRVLAEVDVIAAEDTRRTRKLLTAHSITNKLVSFHEQNERSQTPRLIAWLMSGKRIALVTDGGMPAISDPGYRLVKACVDADVSIELVPGPSAVVSALAISGLPTARFSFEGFLPRKQGDLAKRLHAIADDDRTLVFFEAPDRLAATLTAMLGVFGTRRAAIAREMTKAHEQVIRGTIDSLIEHIDEIDLRGEATLVVEGASYVAATLDSAVEQARVLIESGMGKSKAAQEAAKLTGVGRRQIYEALLQPAANGSQSGPVG